MAMTIVVMLFATTVMLGGYLAWQFWIGERSKKMMSAIHLIIAAAGLEGLVLLLRGAPDGTVAPGGDLGPIAALGLAMAFFTGLCVPLIAKPKPAAVGTAILAHASVATFGFCALLWWLMKS